MKYTNIKKLLIKFMGGGLIDFPTRFLRWVKIDGDTACDDGDGGGGGDSTPTNVYIKFKAGTFGLKNSDNVPGTVDRTKGYALDEIFDMSDNVLEGFIKAQEDARDSLISDGITEYTVGESMGCYYGYQDKIEPSLFNYCSYESGNIGTSGGSYPIISLGFIEYRGSGGYIAKTVIRIEGSNFYSSSGTVPMITFEKSDEDGKWYIVDAR